MELSMSQFWTTFYAAISAFYPQDLDPGNTPQSQVKESYDFIIVGGGSAALDGECEYPRGHVLGGGSTINGMAYARGNKADYDGWVKLGCTGWGYEDVLPYFLKSENCTEPSFCDSPLHGKNGEMNVQYPRYVTKLREEYVRAGEEFGWTRADYNNFHQNESVSYIQFTMNGPSRESTSNGFLLPVKNRKNLSIVQRAVVSKVIINQTKAIGVEYHRNGKKFTVHANKEIIITAGAINSPQLLMLSGIGPKEELMKHNIKVIADLPVGKNLQDHVFTPVIFKINKPYTIRSDVWRTNASIYEYAVDRNGPLTCTGTEAIVFFNPLNKSEPPNSQLTMKSGAIINSDENLIRIIGILIHPNSRGYVTINSTSVFDKPIIDPNYFGEDSDYILMKKIVGQVLDYMQTPTMSKLSPELYLESEPKCRGLKTREELITCLVEQYSQTLYHPVGTAKMGHPQDKEAVVSPNLMVRGFRNLRVVDASVMPVVPRGNSNAATVMIAEKVADFIKAAHLC